MKRKCVVGDGLDSNRSCVSPGKSIRPSEVPQYLRCSDFYQSLNLDEDDTFEIPAEHMKENTAVKSLKEACVLLKTLRFWGVDISSIPSLQKVGPLYKEAVRKGNLDCLMLLDEQPQLRLAANHPRCQVLAVVASQNGHCDCLRFLIEKGVDVHNCAEKAAANGHESCLAIILENRGNDSLAQIENQNAYRVSIHNNQFGCLKCLHESQCLWTEEVSVEAAKRGLIEILQYYHEHGGFWSSTTCHAAAFWGQIDCLRYAHEHGCPLLPPRGKCDRTFLITVIIKRQHWDCLMYLLSHNYPLSPGAISALASTEYCPLVESAVQLGWIVPTEVAVASAARGNVRTLRYALKSGCDRSSQILFAAASGGYEDCLQCAHEYGMSIT